MHNQVWIQEIGVVATLTFDPEGIESRAEEMYPIAGTARNPFHIVSRPRPKWLGALMIF